MTQSDGHRTSDLEILDERLRLLRVPPSISVEEHLARLERGKAIELVFGCPRPIPAPTRIEEWVLGLVFRHVATHLTRLRVGTAVRGPVNVVLDARLGLVVQVPIAVLLGAQESSSASVWGVPEIILECVRPETTRRLRTIKMRWYRQYGVQECWLLEPARRQLEILHLPTNRYLRHSCVLPRLALTAENIFGIRAASPMTTIARLRLLGSVWLTRLTAMASPQLHEAHSILRSLVARAHATSSADSLSDAQVDTLLSQTGVIEAITDGVPYDWDALQASLDDERERRVAAQLKLLAAIARVHRRESSTASRAVVATLPRRAAPGRDHLLERLRSLRANRSDGG